MTRTYVVADYASRPSEGIQVVSKTLVDGLRAQGHRVEVLPPRAAARWFFKVVATRPDRVIFTHGPGKGVVLLSALLRRLTNSKIIWVATRPDLQGVWPWLKGRATAHAIVCNRHRSDLREVAPDSELVQQYIGIDPRRLGDGNSLGDDPWPELRHPHRPIALHVGHIRRSRGLDLLAAAKASLGENIEIVVQSSPTFAHDPEVLTELRNAGVHVRIGYVPELARLYKAADIYLFPAADEQGGAIELPLGVLEAVACGTPILSTAFGALPAALEGVDGVHLTEPSQFVARLKSLVERPDGLLLVPAGLPSHLYAERVIDAVDRAGRAL